MPFTTNSVDLDLVRDVDLILSNDEGVYQRIRAAALESVQNDDASLNDPAGYALAFDNGNSDWDTLCECAGLAIVDVVQDLIEETCPSGFAYDLLTQRLDLGNKHVWSVIAESFMPDPDDV